MRATVARVLGGAGHVLRRAASPGETSPRCVRRAARAGAWDDVCGAFEGWTKQWWWQPAVEGRQCRRVGLLHAHGTSTMRTRSRHDMHTCAYYVDGRPGALPVSSTCAQGARDELLRLASAAGYRDCPSACASTTGSGGWRCGAQGWGGRVVRKNDQKPREGGRYVCCAMCASCVGGARIYSVLLLV